MASTLKELRQRRKSVQSTQKITQAMELIAASRIAKAERTAKAGVPYTRELNRVVSALAWHSDFDHPLTREPEQETRAAVLVLTSDRGLNGAYSSNVIKCARGHAEKLAGEGVDIEWNVVGQKGVQYLNYRGIEPSASWTGFSDAPTYEHAQEIADHLIQRFLTPVEEGGVDSIYVVFTRMVSMLTQEPRVRRVLPIEVVAGTDTEQTSDDIEDYMFEPDAETVLNTLLPLYVRSRVLFFLRQAAASQLASQQRAMKAATDNAQQLIESLARQANQARQAEITQEINEIVGGAGALTG